MARLRGCFRKLSNKVMFGVTLLNLAVLTLVIIRLHVSHKSPTYSHGTFLQHPRFSSGSGHYHHYQNNSAVTTESPAVVRRLSRNRINGTTANTSAASKKRPVPQTKTKAASLKHHHHHRSSSPALNDTPKTRESSSLDNIRHQKTKKLLCIKFKCRLGNHLFMYASVLGIAKKLNRTPVFLGSHSFIRQALKNPPRPPTEEQERRCANATFLREKSCCRFHGPFLTLDPAKDYVVANYLQSWKYFFQVGGENEVRRTLAFRDDVFKAARTALKEELGRKSKNSSATTLLIGVHARRGDYLTEKNVDSGRRTPPAEYYRRAMTYMRTRFGNKNKNNVIFLVSVDNGTWFRDAVTMTSSSSDIIFLKRHKPAVDMALLSSLDHVITSVGTFSWWVGFFNKGVTVYWQDFIAPGTPFGNQFDANGTSFIYPGWIPL